MVYYTATIVICDAVVDIRAGSHDECAPRGDIHAAYLGRAADNTSARQGECAALADGRVIGKAYTAAETTCRASDDAATGHGQCTAGINKHTAAIIVDKITATARNNSTGDNFRAIFVQFPHVNVPGQIFTVRVKVVLCGFVAVRNCQIAVRLYLDYAAAAGHFQYTTVQIQCHSTVDRQCRADIDIPLQCDPGKTAICQCPSQFLRCRHFLHTVCNRQCCVQSVQGRCSFISRCAFQRTQLLCGCRGICQLSGFCCRYRRGDQRKYHGTAKQRRIDPYSLLFHLFFPSRCCDAFPFPVPCPQCSLSRSLIHSTVIMTAVAKEITPTST